MNWKYLTAINQLDELVNVSYTKPQVIFKHSTRCSISLVAKSRLDKYEATDADFWYLDLLNYRDISDLISEKFSVYHESPQILVIIKGKCIYDESHSGIYFEDIMEAIKK